jgi:hypothetical protein
VEARSWDNPGSGSRLGTASLLAYGFLQWVDQESGVQPSVVVAVVVAAVDVVVVRDEVDCSYFEHTLLRRSEDVFRHYPPVLFQGFASSTTHTNAELR